MLAVLFAPDAVWAPRPTVKIQWFMVCQIGFSGRHSSEDLHGLSARLLPLHEFPELLSHYKAPVR